MHSRANLVNYRLIRYAIKKKKKKKEKKKRNAKKNVFLDETTPTDPENYQGWRKI